MIKVWLPVILLFSLILCGCTEETLDIYEESCHSDKPVPIACANFVVDDYSKTLIFTINEIDKVVINESTFAMSGIANCSKKKFKSSSKYYTVTMACDSKWAYTNITGVFSFDYSFMGKQKHTDISYVRLFGKKNALLDRKPLDDFNTQ